MSVGDQAIRLVPGLGDETATANAYLAFTAFGGVLGWGVTAYLANTASGPALRPAWTTPATIAMALWLVVVLLRLGVGYFSTGAGVQLSTPNLVWVTVLLGAYAVTAVGLTVGNADLVVLPWYAAFAVGYLFTGATVTRGAVYLAAGALSVLGGAAAFAGGGAFPAWIALGALHVVPLTVDAAMGGRQRTEDGIPAVQAERVDDTAGGVVER